MSNYRLQATRKSGEVLEPFHTLGRPPLRAPEPKRYVL